jgi:urease accessory protein
MDYEVGLAELRLLQLADSALPIGALSHSFGLESLVASESLHVDELPRFFRGYLEEAGLVEAVFCREAYSLFETEANEFPEDRWVELNHLLSARKTAREARTGSAALGRNFLEAVASVDISPVIKEALRTAKTRSCVIHQCTAFGLASCVMGFAEDRAVQAFLHQSLASLISACQRLLPLGQMRAMGILWGLKNSMIDTANRSKTCSADDAFCFMPLLDWAAMEHPALSTRLFIS